MAKGFDTQTNCGAIGPEIKAAGYDFVGRYLSKFSHKVIARTEAEALSAAGLMIVLVYEDAPTAASYFTPDRGTQDGTRAAQQASLLGAPDAATIYFTVDYDAAENDLTSAIIPYFQSVVGSLRGFAAEHGPQYQTGVYGSGASCLAITGAGLATRGWRACSTGWRGYASYASWSISQSLPTTACGLSVDPDLGVGDFGAFVVAAESEAVA